MDHQPGIGDTFCDDLQFARWRRGIFSAGDREGGRNNSRQKIGDVGSVEHRTSTLKNILCVWKVDDRVAITQDQLRLLTESRLGKKEWQRGIGNRGPLTGLKGLP
jgi:hypothetical protein